MNSHVGHSFDFVNTSSSNPLQISARYLFEPEMIKIPNTEIYAEIPAKTWVAFDSDDELYTYTFDKFNEIFMPENKKSKNYLEFVVDSNNNDYNPNSGSIDELIETLLEDVIEKPVQLSLKGRLALVWDLLLNKKIFISHY